jgi:outer membrane protein OmpA-like peptidoglycan-associated protein
VLSSVCFAVDPDDSPDVKDHPDVPRFPGTVIASGNSHDFGSHDFPDGKGGNLTKEGASWEITYAIKPGAKVPSPLEWFKNYENAFKKKGGATVLKQLDSSGGDGVLKMPLGGKAERWLHLLINNNGEQVLFYVIDEKAMVQQVEVTASEMAEALKKDGKVALRGILFDTGKDTLKPESDAVLAEIVALLKGDANLKVSIDGHTDNVGNAKANLALSKKRAESVKKYLTGKGVAVARLKADGFGDTKPVGPNDTEEGKALNRRVELVKQ